MQTKGLSDRFQFTAAYASNGKDRLLAAFTKPLGDNAPAGCVAWPNCVPMPYCTVIGFGATRLVVTT
jgi:hypothetical protein